MCFWHIKRQIKLTPSIYANGLFEFHEFGYGFGFEGHEIQILCLGKLKVMDLGL